MTVLRLHDPAHRPQADWMSCLAVTQVAVFLRDVKTHVEVDWDGVPVPRNRPAVCYVFDSLPEAEQVCREKVEQAENLLCEVYDRRGKLIEPMAEITSARHQHRLRNPRSAKQKIVVAWLLVVVAPFCFWLDYRHDGTLVVPTIVGFACFVTALRLLFWGHSELSLLRQQAASKSASNL